MLPIESSWHRQITTGNRDAVLLCLPYAGTGAAIFGSWRDATIGAAEIVVAQLPGRDGRLREPPIEKMEEMVGQLADSIVEGPLAERPLSLLGCSFGAIVAYELAHELGRRGVAIQHLVAAASRPPHDMRVTEPVGSLPDEEMIYKLQTWYAAIPPELANNRSMLDLLLPTIRADMRVYESYHYPGRDPLPCPIIAVGGADDRIVTVKDLQGWKQHTSGGFTARQFAGDHFFMKTHPTPVLRLLGRKMG